MSKEKDERPDSPCVAICTTLFDDVCRGCGRTITEIANWVVLDDNEKKEIWDRIQAEGFPRKKSPRPK